MAASALAFHRDPSCSPPPVPLSALIIFSHRSDAELIRSIHLYPGDGTFTAIQQEFRLSPTKYIRVSEPIDAFYSSNFTFDSSEQLLSMYKWLMLNEDPSWACILEFYGHCPYLTTIIPMLSISRNPALHELPSLAHDLDFVEKSVYLRAHENQWNTLSGSQQPSQALWLKQNELLSDDLDVLKSSCILSDMLPLVEVEEPSCCNEEKVSLQDLQVQTQNAWVPPHGLDSINLNWSDQDEFTTQRPLLLEPLNIWSSEIDLGNSHELDFSTYNTSWTSCGTLCNMSVPALESIASPTSSGITTHKADDELWNSDDFLELRNEVLGAEFEMEGLSLSNYVLRGYKEDMSTKGVPSSPLQELFFDNIKQCRGSVPKAHDFAMGNSADGTRSCVSDESIATATGDQSFVNVSSNSCSISSQLQKQKRETSAKDSRPSELETLGSMSLSGKRDSKDVHSKETSSSSHQRGPTERMMEITLDELSQYFHMPITQASKQLKVGLTVLKKRCREFGIPRWPHRKLKSLDSLIHNIQELAKSSQGKPPKDVMAAVRILEEQKKIMEETPGVELAERTKRLRQACFKASYKQRRQAQPHAKLEPSHESQLLNTYEELQTESSDYTPHRISYK